MDLCALAYPVSEAEGLHFWSMLLPRLGLTYLCSPGRNRAPDAYWAVTSRLTKQNRREIRHGLRSGAFAQSLFDEGVVLGIEYESKASHGKKHFAGDGATHISLILCTVDDWSTAPVPVRCLRDFLGVRPPAFVPTEPAFDNESFHALAANIESDTQRFVLLAFLSPESRQIPSGERGLHASVIKRLANEIGALNGYDAIMDIGGALTGFTQPGLKKDLGLLRKGEKAGSHGCRGRNYYLGARFNPRHLRKLAEDAHLHLPEAWAQPKRPGLGRAGDAPA